MLAALAAAGMVGSAAPSVAPVHVTAGTAGAGVSYSGDAYAVGLTGLSVLGKAVPDATFGDTGQLPHAGGELSFAPGTVTLPVGLGTVTVSEGSVTGAGNVAHASSRVAGVSLLPHLSRGSRGGICLPLLGCVAHVSANSLAGLLGPGRGTGDLLDIGALRSTAAASAGAPDAKSTSVGTVSLLGGTVEVPVNPVPNTTVNLGLFSLTLNRQSYDRTTNTASAQALVIHFPSTGMLSGLVTGTITVASSTAGTAGTPPCPSGVTVSGPPAGRLRPGPGPSPIGSYKARAQCAIASSRTGPRGAANVRRDLRGDAMTIRAAKRNTSSIERRSTTPSQTREDKTLSSTA